MYKSLSLSDFKLPRIQGSCPRRPACPNDHSSKVCRWISSRVGLLL